MSFKYSPFSHAKLQLPLSPFLRPIPVQSSNVCDVANNYLLRANGTL